MTVDNLNIDILYMNAKHFLQFRSKSLDVEIKKNIQIIENNGVTNLNIVNINYIVLYTQSIAVCLFKPESTYIKSATNKTLLNDSIFTNMNEVIIIVHEQKHKRSLETSFNKLPSPKPKFIFRVIEAHYLMTNFPKHTLFVEYTLVEDKDSENAIKSYIRDINMLPEVCEMDVNIFWYGFRAGTIIQEKIPSSTCGYSITYKRVVK